MLKAPEPPEPLEVLGIRIPWNEAKQGWLFQVFLMDIGIERHISMQGTPYYRYLRFKGGPWSTSDDLEFSIKAMEKELEHLASNEMLGALIAAVRRKIESR